MNKYVHIIAIIITSDVYVFVWENFVLLEMSFIFLSLKVRREFFVDL